MEEAMTEEDKAQEEEPTDGRPAWLKDIQGAMDRTGDAIRTAWDASRDRRASALESAKRAVEELSNAVDQGISAAKERWAGASESATEEE
jgi:hypothetical protein